MIISKIEKPTINGITEAFSKLEIAEEYAVGNVYFTDTVDYCYPSTIGQVVAIMSDGTPQYYTIGTNRTLCSVVPEVNDTATLDAAKAYVDSKVTVLKADTTRKVNELKNGQVNTNATNIADLQSRVTTLEAN